MELSSVIVPSIVSYHHFSKHSFIRSVASIRFPSFLFYPVHSLPFFFFSFILAFFPQLARDNDAYCKHRIHRSIVRNSLVRVICGETERRRNRRTHRSLAREVPIPTFLLCSSTLEAFEPRRNRDGHRARVSSSF